MLRYEISIYACTLYEASIIRILQQKMNEYFIGKIERGPLIPAKTYKDILDTLIEFNNNMIPVFYIKVISKYTTYNS